MTPAMVKPPEGFTIKFVEDIKDPHGGTGRVARSIVLAPDGREMDFTWATCRDTNEEFWIEFWAHVKKTYDDRQHPPLVEHDEGDHGPEREAGNSG